MKRLLLLACLALTIAAPSAAGQPATRPAGPPATRPTDDLSWLAGNWRVTYADRFLGEVSGWAVAEVNDSGQARIRYTVEHPRTGKRHELHALDTRMKGGELEVRFFGTSPSEAVSIEGEREARREPGAAVLEVPDGGTISVTAQGQTAENTVAEQPVVDTELIVRLKVGGGATPLAGQWQSKRHLSRGFRGLRSGERFDGKHTVGGREYGTQYMRGAETWRREGPQVERVTIAEMDAFGRFAAVRDYFKDKTRLCDAWLRIEGKDLPTKPGERVEIAFEDAKIRYLGSSRPDPKVDGALQVWVELDKDIRVGVKPFTLNGAPGEWHFDFPGLDPIEIRFVRPVREGEFEIATVLYLGELFYVDVIYPHEPFYAERSFMILSSSGGVPRGLKVTKDPRRTTRFRSGPIIVQDVSAAELGEGDLGDANDPNRLFKGMPLAVRGQDGGTLNAVQADAIRPDRDPEVRAIPLAATPGEGRFARALAKARELRKSYADADRYFVSVRIITEGLRKRGNRISVEDHAALMLLYEDISANLGTYVEAAGRPLPDAVLGGGPAAAQFRTKRGQWVQELIKAARSRDEVPLFLHAVPAPDGKSEIPLDLALSRDTADRLYQGDQARFLEYAERSIAFAEGKMLDASANSLAQLRRIDIARPKDLLALAKIGYDQMAPRLANDLVRPANPAAGEPPYPRMVADKYGRAAVLGLGTLIEAIKADEAYSSFDTVYTLIVAAPIGFVTAPAAGASAAVRGAWLAVRGAQIGAELANTKLVYDEMRHWDRASDAADFAKGTSPVTGVEAYHRLRAEARGAAFSAALGGGLAVGVPLFTQAVKLGLRPTKAAMEHAAETASRRGVNALNESDRAAFEFLRGRAEYRAGKYGTAALTDAETKALRAAYPDGLPADVATRLKVKPGDRTWTVLPENPSRPKGDSSYNPIDLPPDLERRALSDSDEFSIDVSDVLPEHSSNPFLRDRYRSAADAASRSGGTEALARQDLLRGMSDEWQRLSPAQQGRVNEAWDVIQRLRKADPDLAKVDEAQMYNMLMFQSARRRGAAPIPPEEMAAIVAGWNRGKVTPSALARAANVSELNAEAALQGADDLLRRFDTRPAPPLSPSSAARAGAETLPDGPPRPTPPLPEPPPSPAASAGGTFVDAAAREKQIAGKLRQMGLNATEADLAAVVPAGRKVDIQTATAGAAWGLRAPPKAVMDALKVDRARLRQLMDNFLKNVQFEPNALRRQKAIDDWLGGEGASTVLDRPGPPPPPPAPPPAAAARPPGPPALDGPVLPRTEAKARVVDSLEAMGFNPAAARRLDLDGMLDRTGDPRVVAAGAARKLDADPSTIKDGLGADNRELAGLLDRFDEAARPHTPPTRRAEDLSDFLRRGGDERPLSSVSAARQARVDRGLRDMGVNPTGQPPLVSSGLDVESSVIGAAMENGVRAETLMARRGLTPEGLRRHVDHYLEYGRGVPNPQERGRLAGDFMAGRYAPAEATWRAPATAGSSRVIGTSEDVAEALTRMKVDPVTAGQRAGSVSDVASRDVYQAITGVAMESRVPPSALRETFGLTDSQIAAKLDQHLRDTVGIASPARRAEMIAGQYLARSGEGRPLTASQVRDMISRAPPVETPLRPRTTATTPTALDRPLRPTIEAAARRPLPPPPPPLPRSLDDQFGRAVGPSYVKPFERRADGGVIANTKLLRVGDKPWITYPQGKYIWAIDEAGELIMGIEAPIGIGPNGEALLLGHPTLMNAGRARIAGELRYSPDRGWVINNASGRYSAGREPPDALRPEHLRNVAERFERAGLRVDTEFQ